MEFIVKNGPFIKDKNNKFNIELINLIALIPFLIYRILDNIINNSIIVFISLLSTLLVSIFIDYVRKNLNFKNYIKDINYAIIISLIVPINTPYILIFIINIILVILSKFISFINYKAILGFICSLFVVKKFGQISLTNYNNYIFISMTTIIILILILKRSFKFRISISFILFVIFNIILNKSIDSNSLLLMLIGIYVIPEFNSTPNSALIQFLYGIALGILSIFLPLQYLFFIVVVFSILFKYMDRYYIYYLAKK